MKEKCGLDRQFIKPINTDNVKTDKKVLNQGCGSGSTKSFNSDPCAPQQNF
jgi:hypothetical protein